jgi:leucyl aminopeptidase
VNCFANADEAGTALPVLALTSGDLAGFQGAAGGNERRWIEGSGFRAEPGTTLLLPGPDGAPARVLAGIADPADPLALAHLPLALPPGTYRLDASAGRAIDPGRALLGWGMGAYQYERYRRPARAPARLVLDGAAEISEAFAELKATLLVRDLVNTPTQDLGPDQLEAAARRVAQAYGARASSIVGEALLEHNFPTIHAVGRAAARAPRLVELNWGADGPQLVLVGKGVCFDTGGLNLKTGDGMRWMKKDMGGAAHALALAQLVMARKLPVRLTLLLPMVENAVAGDAYRPGEVILTRGGHSVEVDNTDAEGRLVLCDALAYAAERHPDLILDVATLTGAARIALGPDLPALYSNDGALREQLIQAGNDAYDPVWPMPLWRPYLSYLKSYMADMANTGSSRMAGSITAALFLERFIPEGQRWVHFDTYAWNDADRAGKPQGGEAQGLRASFQFLKRRYAAA